MRDLKKTAAHLKRNQTVWEYRFAKKLRAWNVKFKAQHVIGPWIADFYLPHYELVVELDGSGHFTESGVRRDRDRNAWFEKNGYRILHIRNTDIEDFQFSDLFESGKNGPVVVTDEGLPNYLYEWLASLPE